jgi:hypothetical protein
MRLVSWLIATVALLFSCTDPEAYDHRSTRASYCGTWTVDAQPTTDKAFGEPRSLVMHGDRLALVAQSNTIAVWHRPSATLEDVFLIPVPPWNIALTNTHVFFTLIYGGAVAGIALDDGAQVAIDEFAEIQPTEVAADDDWVYWFEIEMETSTQGRVMKGRAGVEPIPMALTQAVPWSLTIDDIELYWFDGPTLEEEWAFGPIKRIPKAGGVTQVVAEDAHRYFAVHERRVYYTSRSTLLEATLDQPTEPRVLAELPGAHRVLFADDAHVYLYGDGLARVPIEGGCAEALNDGPSAADEIIADAERIHWLEGTQLWSAAK